MCSLLVRPTAAGKCCYASGNEKFPSGGNSETVAVTNSLFLRKRRTILPASSDVAATQHPPDLSRDPARNERKMSPSEGANRRRSERVMLQIPIVVLTETLEHEAMREETQTMIVNAHGGLVKLQMEVMPGQPIELMHPRSGTKAAARVVRVDNPPGGFTAVG